MRTDNGDDGAVVGKHLVLILDLKKQFFSRTPRGPQPKEIARQSPEMAKRLEEQLKSGAEASRVSPSYGRFNETPLRVEVHPGPQIIDLEVK